MTSWALLVRVKIEEEGVVSDTRQGRPLEGPLVIGRFRSE